MGIFDNLKDLADMAQDKVEAAQGMLKSVEGYLPEDRREQLGSLLDQAEGALSSVTGRDSDQADQATDTQADATSEAEAP